ncbi:MAG: fimbrial biogenesis chaperone [Endomicrobiales bacterium]
MFKTIIMAAAGLLLNASLYASLMVSPGRQEVGIPPGAVFKGTYTVTNNYDVPAEVKAQFRDWFTLPENKKFNINDWLKAYPESFSLQPGESKTVNYEVRVPRKAKGELVAMVSFSPETGESQGVKLLVSSALFVIVSGTEKYKWDVPEVKVTKNRFGKFVVEAFVKNTGNIHVRPAGSVRIVSNDTKETVLQLDFAESRPVYPGASRQIIAHADFALKPGKYTAISTVRAEGGEREKKVNFKVVEKAAGETVIE